MADTFPERMNRRKNVALPTAVILALLITAAASVIVSAVLVGYRTTIASEEARSVRLRGLAELSLVILSDAADAPDDLKALAWSGLRAKEPSLAAVALLDSTGKTLYAQGESALLRAAAEAVAGGITAFRQWEARAPESEEGDRVTIGAMPVRAAAEPTDGGTLLLALREPRVGFIRSNKGWVLLTPLLGAAAAGTLVGAWLLYKDLLQPLRALARQIEDLAADGDGLTLPDERPDEIGRLARAVNRILLDRHAWRENTTRLKSTMDRRVNAEVRRINVELRQAEAKMWTDPLTGLGNRRLFDDKLEDVVAAQRLGGHDLALIMIDIDNFKNLNDTRGHVTGDEILRFVGELLRQFLRSNDLAVRFGGDEFTLILPFASAADAAAVAERTIRLFGQRARLLDVTPPLSMSAGIASLWGSGSVTAEELVRCADTALYRAKRLGKNRVAVFEREQVTAGIA